jgi:peptide/nickel transport system ATP-binding protein
MTQTTVLLENITVHANHTAAIVPPLLSVRNYRVRHLSPSGASTILSDVSFDVGHGEIVGLIGESGAGKSTLGNAILGLMGAGLERTSGSIVFDGIALEGARHLDAMRGHRIAAIFQDHTASLDPLMTAGRQIEETILALDRKCSRKQAQSRAITLMHRVGIPNAESRYRHYPHQFSGGQKQRLVIAIAFAGAPDLIIADEPTSALDATVQKQILQLLRTLVDETGVSIILVTHDMGVIAEITDRVVVMKKGAVVEQGPSSTLLDHPTQAYTRSLLAAVPRMRVGRRHSKAVTDVIEHTTRFTGISATSAYGLARSSGQAGDPPVLAAQSVSKSFAHASFFSRRGGHATRPALDDVSLTLKRGTITGIVGESGSGKTTLGRILSGLETASAGCVHLGGESADITHHGRRNGLLGKVQMIFQDPSQSLNPAMRIRDALHESIRDGAGGSRCDGRAANDAAIAAICQRLGLSTDLLDRHPHQLSGGQRQRICIARALLAEPQLIVADEPTSALDVSVQAEIAALLSEIVAEQGVTIMFISHDLALVQALCSSVYILKDGRIVDGGDCETVFSQSRNPYTRSLIEARSARFTD